MLRAFLAILVFAAFSAAQDRSSMPWLSVEFPRDSPLGVISFSLGDSTASVRGVSLALGLHTSITLRNLSDKRVRGLTLRVEAQDLTPSGRASVTVPSLNVSPGEAFPVRLDLELLRPFNDSRNGGALVQVALDCVLFDDLSSYGPDRVRSHRSLTVYELEARRDRRYFRNLVDTGQFAKLQQEMDFGLPDLRPPQLGFELLSNADPRNLRGSHPLPVAIVPFPDSPVQMLDGAARVFQNEIQAPEVNLQNRSAKKVESIEVGWILRDQSGRDYMAGSLPAEIEIDPVRRARIQPGRILRFSHPSGRPVLVNSVTAFVSNVEFDDGQVWIPTRTDITNVNLEPSLKRAMASSPEQQRLVEIYRHRGINGLAVELKKAND